MTSKRLGIVAMAFAVSVLTVRCTMAEDRKPANPKNPVVSIETSEGEIQAELFQDKAPVSTANFLMYASEGYFDGTIFHRVMPNFMVQGGGMLPDLKEKDRAGGKKKPEIKNEAMNGLKNETGTLAMARTPVIDSATSQFFVNVRDNDFLDHKDSSPQGFGYAVFGQVVKGMDIVRKIEKVPTTSKGMHDDVPETTIVIKSVKVVKPAS